jgi:hypothetical protein
MTRLLLCTATILALTASASAQRELTLFGPNPYGEPIFGPLSVNCRVNVRFCNAPYDATNTQRPKRVHKGQRR